MIDNYKNRLKHAKWTWREDRPQNQKRVKKDRQSGRHDKRGARQDDRREIERERDPRP